MRTPAETTERTSLRAALDRLGRDVAVCAAIAITTLAAATLCLTLALNASGALALGVLLYIVVMAAIAVAASGGFIILARRQHTLGADITHLEERVEELSDRNWEILESEERAKSFLEAQGDLIVRRDHEGRITYANDAFCALAGRGRDALVGSRFAFGTPAENDIAVLADGTRVHDQKIETEAGTRWIAWRDVTVRAGRPAHTETQSVGRDVTDRVSAEHALASARDQADAANRAKSRFLAMVSHEIRTPLNGILGMADLVLDTKLTAEQTTYINAIKTSGDTLLSLIEEVLDFSKIEAGKLDLDARPFALSTLIEEVVELLSPRAVQKDIEVASLVDERLPTEVVGDVTRLRQVLLNLAGNAVKFTDKGGVSIVVEPGLWPDEINFEVRDTGIGIPPEAQELIFEEFEQVDSGATRKFGGTGLGLAISKRIIERMGGRISVDSAPNIGSTFTFALALPSAERAAVPTFTPPDLANAAVLIAAPGQTEPQLIARRLAAWGAQACIVSDPKVAGALLPERNWDTLIVDRALGAEATQAIVQACPRATVRRLVLVTPNDRDELASLKQAGFNGYLVKPVRGASLAARFDATNTAFERSDDGGAERDARLLRRAAQTRAGLSILVAEDNDINALLARALLAKLGHRPTVATTGTSTVESWLAAQAAGEPYDLVLMDVHMPGMDGLEATRRIRAAEAAQHAKRTPIVALTANAFTEDRSTCVDAGMDAFLTKPLDRDRLAEALSTLTKPSPAPLAA